MVGRLFTRLGAALLGCAVAFASAAEHSAPSHGMSGAARSELGASAAFDGDGKLWAVYKEGAHVMWRRSPDAGRTWSDAQAVNGQPEPVAADGDSRPKIATGPGGELYVTWTQPRAKPYTGFVRFARSVDGGKTFAAPITVHADRQEITHRFDSIAVTPDGKVFVAWIDKRDGAAPSAAGAPAYRGAAVYYAVSDDRGASFRGDYRVAHHSCECCRIALVPQADGTVLALWRHVFEPNVRDHAWAQLGAGGTVGAVKRATFDDWKVDACPHHGPSLAKDGMGRLHAVWYSGAPGKEGVFYGRLREGAVDGQRRIGGDGAAHADLAIAGKRIAIAWKEFDGQRTALRALRSDDGGGTWREVQLAASEGPTDQPKVLVRGDTFHVFWNTREQPLRVVALP
jgi:hypothetical protein